MRTIIQHIGPLYGEKNTGTVFGQPNGSIAIGQGKAPAPSPDPTPITPTIKQIWTISRVKGSFKFASGGNYMYSNMEYITRYGGWDYIQGYAKNDLETYTCNPAQTIMSISLDEAIASTDNIMKVQIASDDTFSTILAEISQTAGNYTTQPKLVTDMTVVSGTVYYVRLALCDSSGNDLGMISNTLTFTGTDYR